jgi:DNA primase
MTQKISDEELERCRSVPLHYVVGNQRVDRKVKIQCPFHAENTPSCTLYPNNGRYNGGFKCFGCTAKGNSIDFLMKLGATYKEAVEELRKFI